MKSPTSNVGNLATSGHSISTLSANGASTDRLARNVTNSMRSTEEKKYPVPSVAINVGSTPSNLNEVIADLRQRGITGSYCKEHYVSGGVPSFKKPHFAALSKLYKEARLVLCDKRAKRILALIVFTSFSMSCFFSLSSASNSAALTAYTYISVFDMSILMTCLLSIWVEQQRPNPTFTFGYGRFEVVAVFSCTVLAIVGAVFVFKECLERLYFWDQQIDGSMMLLGTGGVLFYRLIVIHCTDSRAWNHVFISSKSSWLQRHITECCENLCQVLPGLSRFLLPRLNPFVLMAHMGAAVLVIDQFFIQLKGYYTADYLAGLCIAMLTWTTMYPIFTYTGLILLQTTPAHVISHIDKSLREAATLDGVLEFRNEHFWTLSFGVLAGSIHVRVRRDANEQVVLGHLINRLSTLVPVLTIQVFKDDWTRGSNLQLLNEPPSRASTAYGSQTSTPTPLYRVATPPNFAPRLPESSPSPWNISSRNTSSTSLPVPPKAIVPQFEAKGPIPASLPPETVQ